MKNLFTYLKALWGAWGNLQSKDVRHDCRLTVGSPSGLDAKWKQNPFMRFAVVLTLIFTIGSGNVWGVAPTLSDLTFSTESSVRIVNEDFSSASATDKTAKMAADASLSGFGAFNKGYNNSTSNHYAIESSTFSSNALKITMGSASPCGVAISGKTFGTKGAWRIKTTKSSRMQIGIYAAGATGTVYAKADASVWIKNDAGSIAISKNASTSWQSVGSSSNTYIDICVIYNNTSSATTYGNGISLGGKKAHVYIDGTCIMNGESPKAFDIPGSSLTTFRVYPIATSGYVACVDDIQIWNALPTAAAASCTANPTVGNAANNGALVYSTTPMTVPITCPSIGAGSASCSIKDYGFVWKAGGNPSISDNKTPIGTDNHSTAFSGNISGTFAAGTTYYVKAYAINNGDNTKLSSSTYSFTPRSITMNSNGGSDVTTILVINGTAATQPANPTKTGYTFGGWYTDNGTFASAVNWSSNITSNQTYYAKWAAKTTTISFNQTSGTGGQTGTLTATYDAAMPSAPVTVPTRDGYDFGGYYDGSGGTGTQYYTNTGASARNWDKEDATYTLHAKWTVKTTTVSFNQNGGDGGQTSSLTATYGSAMPTPITKPTKDGYIFDGYYESSGGTGTKYYNANGTSATTWNKEDATWTLYAKWVDKGCTTHAGTNVTSGTTPSNQLGPVDLYYKYCTRQILYTKTDLNLGATKKGTIKSIYFDYATAVTKKGSVKIYMANTSLTALSTSNYVPFESFTEVYDGSFNSASTGYQEIELTTSFEYNGLGNLVVLIDDNSGQYELSTNFNTHTATTTTGAQIYKQNDSSNEDPSTTNWSTYTASNSRPNTKFCIQEADMVEATVNWYVNGEIAHTQTDYEGTALSDIPTPVSGDCDGVKVFKGWYTSTYSHATDAPDYVSPTVIPEGGANYYAVFATETGGSGDYEYIGDDGMLEEDKIYIFVSSTSTGSAYALKSSDLPANTTSGLTGTAVGVTISSGPKITTENTDLEFTCTTHDEDEIDELKIGSTSNYLRINGNGIGYGDARAYYDDTGLYGWNNSGDTWYDVYYNSTSGEFEASASASSRVYAFEKQTATYSNFSTTCCTQHTITLASSGSVTGGTFNSGGVAKACATRSITLTATPSNSGYVFNGWTVEDGSSNNVTTTVLGSGHEGDNPAAMTMPDYNVTVTAAFSAISSISVKTAPTKTVYLEGETFDPTGLVITATYANSATVDVPYADNEASFTFSPTTATTLTTSHTAVTITYSGETVNQSISVYSVTRQALDEQGNAIADGGPGVPTFTPSTRAISPAADAANYKFKQWTISGAELGSAATTKGNSITNPTGNVTVTAVYYLPRTVTWLVNGDEWKPYTDKGSGTNGTAVVTRGVAWSTLTLPTDPDPLNDEGCGQKFMGWVAVPITGELDKDDDAAAITALDIMTSANQSTKTGAGHNVNNNITFYAVFADYVE